MINKQEVPEKFISHFNEMKELIFDKSIKSEADFIKKAEEIGEKHFGHKGDIIEGQKTNE